MRKGYLLNLKASSTEWWLDRRCYMGGVLVCYEGPHPEDEGDRGENASVDV